MTVIIGRSGEGKSVLLKQIIGLIKPTSGKIIVDGTDICTLSEKQLDDYYKRVGYVFQFAALLIHSMFLRMLALLCLKQAKK